MLGSARSACHGAGVTDSLTTPTSPLQIGDYRRYWLARFMGVFATMSMVVLLGYQLYAVARDDYGMSIGEASFQLGLLGLAQFIPLFVLTPVAGLAADRFDRRHVAAFANGIDGLVAVLLAALTYADALNLPVLFALAAAHGAARVFLGPSMSAIAPNIVPPRLLPRAIALSSIAWQTASVAGPAVGGLVFAAIPWAPHALSAVLLGCGMILILTVRPVRAAQDGPKLKPLKQIAQGMIFVWRERFLLGCITLDLFAVLLAGATALLPVFARDILFVGPEGLGLMRAAPAVGAAAVALWLSFRPLQREVGVKMLWAVAAFGALTVVFALSRSFALSLAILSMMGAVDMISVFIRSSLVQLFTPDDKRGRVSAISGLAISASNELGEMQSGLAAGLLGAVGAVVFGGMGAIVVTLVWAWYFPELRRARSFEPQELKREVST
ncbi:MFS transporter [Erythrobacter neustonensis]|uniref:Multidrug efflux pump Tap n=1 Tax=Erythrobacter neustonensis TaxID=1112 RepID=A0A192D620_9SPHN|nr:MFS transporter [Erythrobacter neustonensis]